jgi:hypothetical protein
VPDPRYASGCWQKGCKADADCNADTKEVCWPRANVCVPARPCKSDDECDIYNGQWCEPKAGLCRPKTCTKTADCPPCSLNIGCGPTDETDTFGVSCDTTAGACLPQ